jgi:excisionase family DNA binding protein
MQVLGHSLITEEEKRELDKIAAAPNDESYVPKLVGPDGDFIILPQAVFKVLKQIVNYMVDDKPILLISYYKELTTQEAAQILGVSRPYLINLLAQKKIPFTKVGSHRRIKLNDLLNYKKRRQEEQERALDELAQMSQDLGLYR